MILEVDQIILKLDNGKKIFELKCKYSRTANDKWIMSILYSTLMTDEFYEAIFIKPSKKLGLFLWKFFDVKIIDGFGPYGISTLIKKCSIKAKEFQSGFIYQYAFVMLLGFSALLTFLIIK